MGKQKMSKILHKSHARERKTVCGINYDNTIMHNFIPNQLVGHWRRVTCKRCLKLKRKYKDALSGKGEQDG